MKEMWNERYSNPAYAYGKEPNAFFAASLKKYKPENSILLAAEGEGRNAVYAATLGLKTYAFDISEEGKRKAIQLAEENQVEIHYELGDFMEMNFSETSFDAVGLIYAHFPPAILSLYHKKLASLIQPKGYVILEGFSKNNLPLRMENPRIGGPDHLDMLFSTESILADFPNFEILQLEEAEIDLNEGLYHNGRAKVIRFVGRKL